LGRRRELWHKVRIIKRRNVAPVNNIDGNSSPGDILESFCVSYDVKELNELCKELDDEIALTLFNYHLVVYIVWR
jgi:hypothetical protein